VKEPETLIAAEMHLKVLMLAALNGDARAYRTLLAELSVRLRAYYARRLATAADAEDLVQETLLAIHKRRATYDVNQPFTAWVYAIARYKLIDNFRRSRSRATIPLEDAGALFADDEAEAASAKRDVEQLLNTLPKNKRELIRLTRIEGLSTAETAAKLGLSESAVKVGVHRALKTLAQQFSEKT
jgi:RNA polymerase sigma-70 factor (ECF subfamily)